MSVSGVLRRITSALDGAGITYMLTGSFASAHHGAPRSTQDIDIVIAADPVQLQTFVRSLSNVEYYSDLDAALEAHERQSLFNVIDLATGWKIDQSFADPACSAWRSSTAANWLPCRVFLYSWLAPKTLSSRSWSGQSWRNRNDSLRMWRQY
jgi:predicted nucleotidyltransferase